MNSKWIVVTTINKPTDAIFAISKLCSDRGWRAVVVGDKKTTDSWHVDNIDYLSVQNQIDLFPELSDLIPYNHYCRKNIGYLYAINHGASVILETDDDNIPYEDFGEKTDRNLICNTVSGHSWINIYRHFTDQFIWPRGLPLDEIRNVGNLSLDEKEINCPIQQFLADLDPDVDAIYRLIFNKEVSFSSRTPIAIEKDCWVPFNSQNTLFFKESFALLYLPCFVSFRMTDIWRSFVAQQVLWIFNYKVAFLSPTVKQIRNEHNLLKDFSDEVPGYLQNKKIADILSERAKSINPDIGIPLAALALWEALAANNIIEQREIRIIRCWLNALHS